MPSTKKTKTSCHAPATDEAANQPPPTAKQSRNAEDLILAAFTVWAWNAFPAARRAWWHVPNEMVRVGGEKPGNHRRRLAQAKAKGVVKGVMDVHGVWRGQFWVIEFKAQGGTVSDDQLKFRTQVQAQGALVWVVWDLPAAQTIFTGIMNGDYPEFRKPYVKEGVYEWNFPDGIGGAGFVVKLQNVPIPEK